MHVFEDTIINGNPSGNTAILYAYGVYLSNGGKPEDFMDFTISDVQIMLLTHTAEQKRRLMEMVRMMNSMVDDTNG